MSDLCVAEGGKKLRGEQAAASGFLPVFWLLGMSGSGKTTLGAMLAAHLAAKGFAVKIVDGDEFRKTFGFAGFRPEDRIRNIDAMRRHVMELQALGNVCIVSAITPYNSMRERNRREIPAYNEIWINCELGELVRRDTKGLYKLAASGALDNMTGLSDKFEKPEFPSLIIPTSACAPEESFAVLRRLADGQIKSEFERNNLFEALPKNWASMPG